MLLLWIYIAYRGHLELEKRKVANTIKSTHWSGKHTVISLQKSYNGRKHNNKVALSLGEFAAYVEQKQPSLQIIFFCFFFWQVTLECAEYILWFDFNLTKLLQRWTNTLPSQKEESSLIKMWNKRSVVLDFKRTVSEKGKRLNTPSTHQWVSWESVIQLHSAVIHLSLSGLFYSKIRR